ncbi:hypothetical protein [Hespellia stercorisuis]|uniref:Uncharacterized protein n=1 Tax=Hespellia stercorisuis DSM 15480 TaxID=1121950 RepID=A0A1M6VGW1_9FIRM|nr:hypothetical protein [Hespellia stercorisuis]SHK80742.1 hypothetical protein SAMN02745243_03769 [Hespellia stercorisuis DSM 15480]
MIHSENGLVTLKGDPAEIAAELTIAIAQFRKTLEEDVSKAYADGAIKMVLSAAHLDPEMGNKQEMQLVDENILLEVMTDAHIRILNGFMKDDIKKIDAVLGTENERPKVDVALLYACMCEILFSHEENVEE